MQLYTTNIELMDITRVPLATTHTTKHAAHVDIHGDYACLLLFVVANN